MFRIRIIVGVGSAIAVLSTPCASAEKLTLSCIFESGTFGQEQGVNRVIFDTERPRVDLRVAQTMETNAPVNWVFENNTALKDSIQLTSTESRIAVAAIRYGRAVVINYDSLSGLLNWSQADGSASFRYRCHR